ncbi:coniferyl aldehyde dehydrogenase [Vibrio makurazakiensis]|uniref:coniferyl aldehyde dehydrogenase n=1 Tax=Vibrio makurazakiensis TaxID=2910250 RepID=UPI003D0B1853
MNAQNFDTAEFSSTKLDSAPFDATSLKSSYISLKSAYKVEPYPEVSGRIERLEEVKHRLLAIEKELVAALQEDYGYRSEFDSVICDLMPAVQHINYTTKHLSKWVKSDKRHAGLMLSPSKVTVEYQPLGVVGVIVPWNFPIVLSIAPIVTVLAAGNRVMVKLSEHTPSTNQRIKTIFANLSEHVICVEGAADVASQFSALPFDHVMFTGSTAVGKLVAKAAAENLTPVTLELGGKSPAVIAKDADIVRSVSAILLGKSINAGQICVAPDYVLLPEGKEQAFVDEYLKQFERAYLKGTLSKRSAQSLGQVTHIINEGQLQRLKSYLTDAQSKGATLHNVATKYEQLEAQIPNSRLMLPQLLTGVTEDMLVMQHEVFGPLLPIKTYGSLDEALAYINEKPRPLALYLMTNDRETKRKVMNETHSGTVGINETLLQVAADDSPFGGVGESGMGRYHGIEGFRTFSHAKTVLDTPVWLPRSKLIVRYKKLIQRMLSALFLR